MTSAKISSNFSQWDAGESRNLSNTPEQAYRGIRFHIKLDKSIVFDTRFSFFKTLPLWLVDDTKEINSSQKLPHRETDTRVMNSIKEYLLKVWPTIKIDDRLSYYLLEENDTSKIFSISATIDRCKDGWSTWKRCNDSKKVDPCWLYFGIDIKNSFKMIDLNGNMNAGFTIANKNPEYNFFLLGDINKNASFEYLYFSDKNPEGSNVATIYEIYHGKALPIWNWSDFQE